MPSQRSPRNRKVEVTIRGRKLRGTVQSVRYEGTIYVVRITRGAETGQTYEVRPEQVRFLD